MSEQFEQEHELHLTASELTNLKRIFNIIGEENLKANYFTKADIADVYSVLEKLIITMDEAEIEGLPA
jgi:hypothetical protein